MSETGRKQGILIAAERLFSQESFEAVSIRDIAAAADVNSALIRYYFGAKRDLYRSIFERRYPSITRTRVSALEALRRNTPEAAPSVTSIVACWVRPLVELAAERESAYFIALLAREAGDATKDRHGVIADYLDPSASICIHALHEALPGAGEAMVVQGYLWMIAVAMSGITAAGRARRLVKCPAIEEDSQKLCGRIVTFVTAGLLTFARDTEMSVHGTVNLWS